MPLATDWTKRCDSPEDKAATEQAIRQAGPILEILRETLVSRAESIKKTDEKDYTKASWSHFQAHRNGRHEELDYVIKLLTLKD